MCISVPVFFKGVGVKYKQTNTTATHLYWEFPLGAYIGNHLNNGSSETYNWLKSAESQGTKKRGQKISGPFFPSAYQIELHL